MKLGVDIFALRFQPWDAFQYLEYAHQIGLDLVHFSDFDSFERMDDAYLGQIKARADALGLEIEVGMLSICPTSSIFSDEGGTAVEQLEEALHVADILGSRVVRCVLGSGQDRQGETPFEAHVAATVATCRAVRDRALDLGIKLAIENHAGDMQGWELAALIKEAGPEYVGACIDTGNPIWTVESPMTTLEHLAPYVVTSHIRDTAVWKHPRGAAAQWVTMGEGNVGIEAWAQAYKEQCPDAPFTLEVITTWPSMVINYLEPEFWERYPDTPAAEFARFLQLVEGGEPFSGPGLTVGWEVEREDLPPEYVAALAVQQRTELERSVRYCRDVLSV